MSTAEVYSPGLEGVIAGETAVSTITGGLRYRGYPVTELATRVCFEEVAHLLLHGELPSETQLSEFQKRVRAAQTLPPAMMEILRQIPANAPPMDSLRTAVSALAHFDPDTDDCSTEANLRKSERLLGQIPVVIAASHRLSKGKELIPAHATLPFANNMLYMLTGEEPTAEAAKAFDISLILYAEHEFNASTFTARVVTSTMADMHSAVTAAIGALKGPLHGGANERVVDILMAIDGPETAEQWIRNALANKERVMGFGHRVYKNGDIRAKILKEYARKAAEVAGNTKWEEIADIIEKVMAEEKNLLPNLDWPAGRLYYALGLDVPLYTPFFVASRITGWCAHIMEQAANNRLIRPKARYTGPDLRPVPEK